MRQYRSSRNRPRRDRPLQVLVRRRDHLHVDGDGRRPAHPLDLPLLEHPQQLRLQGGLHVADLVEQDRPPRGPLEVPDPTRRRPRERPPLVPEQLALEQRLGDRRAVHGDERTRLARAVEVQAPRHQLLAGAALAPNEDRDAVTFHRPPHQPVQALHRGAGAQDPVERPGRGQLAAQAQHLGLHPLDLDLARDVAVDEQSADDVLPIVAHRQLRAVEEPASRTPGPGRAGERAGRLRRTGALPALPTPDTTPRSAPRPHPPTSPPARSRRARTASRTSGSRTRGARPRRYIATASPVASSTASSRCRPTRSARRSSASSRSTFHFVTSASVSCWISSRAKGFLM